MAKGAPPTDATAVLAALGLANAVAVVATDRLAAYFDAPPALARDLSFIACALATLAVAVNVWRRLR